MLILKCSEQIEDQVNKILISFSKQNAILWIKEKAAAMELYGTMIRSMNFDNNTCKSTLGYDKIKEILQKLTSQYNYLEESLKGMLLFMYYIAKNLPEDILFVYNIFSQIMKYFRFGVWRSYVVQQAAEYILNISLKVGINDYTDFCNDILYYVDYIDITEEEKINLKNKLENNRDINILKIVDDCMEANQPFYAIKKCIFLYEYENQSINIKIGCLKRLIKIYEKLEINELKEKFQILLDKIN